MAFSQACSACIGRVVGRFGIELLIVALAVIQCLGFIGTYMIAVGLNHVTPDIPYMSDTGGKIPESCVFTFVLCVSAVIALVVMYIRYHHIHQYYRTILLVKWTNLVSFILAILIVLGMIMVGSFQDDAVIIAHFVGAMLVFVLGVVYMWLHTFISYRIYHANLTRHHGSIIIVLRLLLSILCTFALLTTIALGLTASHFHDRNENVGGGTFKWLPRDGGFAYHVVSTVTEWTLGIGFLLYIVTFHSEFSRITVAVSVNIRTQGPEQLPVSETTPLML